MKLARRAGPPTRGLPSPPPQRERPTSPVALFTGNGPTGFGFASTAESVTEGLDLTGRNSGLGLETMRVLAMRGAHVIGSARTVPRAKEALDAIQHAGSPVACELSEPASVRACVAAVKALGKPLDASICNAGVINTNLQRHLGGCGWSASASSPRCPDPAGRPLSSMEQARLRVCAYAAQRPMSAAAVAVAPLSAELTRWRWRIFASTWLCYAGLYFARKPFYISKSALGLELGFDATSLGLIGSVYLVAYAVGQFIAGALGTKLGPRVLLLAGMAISLAVNAAFGFTNSIGAFLGLMAVNGLCQATGWSGTVGTMANWFRKSERGTVMGIWATNFQVGGVLANLLAAWALGKWGYRYSFFTGSLVLLAVWAFFLFHQRDKPGDVGLPEFPEDDAAATDASATPAGWTRAAMLNVFLVGVFYFFVKFIRYSLWSWAPFFLERNFGLKGDDAGYLSTLFDFAGIAGVVVTGVLSDKVFGSRRSGVSLLMMLAMLASCLLLYVAGGVSVALFAVCLALVGFTLYGPDALMSGAGAMDLGSKRGAVLAAGIINGMGSIGAVVQELLIGNAYDSGHGALGPIFALLLASSAAAALAIGVVWVRSRRGHSRV